MNVDSLKRRAIIGLLWSASERFLVQGGQFVTKLVIARVISPSDYGLFGMVAIFLVLSDVIINSGFSQALIQKKNRTEIDYSTIFYLNIILSIVIYIILYVSAPYISDFYNTTQLTDVIRILSVSIIIKSLSVVQYTRLSIELNFRLKTIINFWAVVISGASALWFAFNNYGVMALVYQTIIYSVSVTLLMFIIIRWRPLFVFSVSSLKKLFNFGSKIFLANLGGIVSDNSYSVLIGRYFSSSDVGYYTQGRNLPDLLSVNLFSVLQGVMFPIMSSTQDDKERLIRIYKKSLDMTAFIVIPAMVGLVLIAEPFVNYFLTEKWLPSVIIIQWLALSRMVIPLSALNGSLLNAIGRSDLYLKVDIIKLPLTIIVLIATIPFGLLWIVIGNFVVSLICFFINAHFPGKIFNYGALSQIKGMFKTVLATIIMIFSVLYIRIDNGPIDILLKISLGFLIYFFASILLRNTPSEEFVNFIKKKLSIGIR